MKDEVTVLMVGRDLDSAPHQTTIHHLAGDYLLTQRCSL